MMCDTRKYATDEGCDKYTITHQVVNAYGEVIDCTEYREEEPQECTCAECGKRFRVTPELEWYYNTETIDGEMTEEEHEEKYG